MSNGLPTLTIQEAMEELGVSDKTVRRLLKRGTLEKHSEVHGRILITAESIRRVKTQTPRPPEAPDEPEQAGSYAMVPASHYEALQQTTHTLAETVREQTAYIRQLQQELAEAQRSRGLSEADRARIVAEIRVELQTAQASPGSSLRTESTTEGSPMRRLLRRLFG